MPNPVTSDAVAKCEGGLAYTDRPAAVRAIMRLMYDNSAHYRTVSALFVDRSPIGGWGSVRIFVQRPHTARAAIHASLSGAGRPSEIRLSRPDGLYRYSPSERAFSIFPRAPELTPPTPLNTLPPTLERRDDSATSFADGGLTSGVAALANDFVHPAAIITSPFFTSKRVRLLGAMALDGRSAWRLEGTQVRTLSVPGGLVTAWRMWVDRRTGIVLKIVYLSGTRVAGSAELTDLSIDGQGSAPGGGDRLASWSIPADARYVAPLEYGSLRPSSTPAPLAWASNHSDVVLGVSLIVVLLSLRWLVGRGARGGTSGTDEASLQSQGA